MACLAVRSAELEPEGAAPPPRRTLACAPRGHAPPQSPGPSGPAAALQLGQRAWFSGTVGDRHRPSTPAVIVLCAIYRVSSGPTCGPASIPQDCADTLTGACTRPQLPAGRTRGTRGACAQRQHPGGRRVRTNAATRARPASACAQLMSASSRGAARLHVSRSAGRSGRVVLGVRASSRTHKVHTTMQAWRSVVTWAAASGQGGTEEFHSVFYIYLHQLFKNNEILQAGPSQVRLFRCLGGHYSLKLVPLDLTNGGPASETLSCGNECLCCGSRCQHRGARSGPHAAPLAPVSLGSPLADTAPGPVLGSECLLPPASAVHARPGPCPDLSPSGS